MGMGAESVAYALQAKAYYRAAHAWCSSPLGLGRGLATRGFLWRRTPPLHRGRPLWRWALCRRGNAEILEELIDVLAPRDVLPGPLMVDDAPGPRR